MKYHPDTYKEVRTIIRDGFIARVYIPNITDEERDRRRKEIGEVALRLLASNKE